MSGIVPVAKVAISIRPAVAGDLAFVDRLQDMHYKAVGYMRTAQLVEKIARGDVLIAEDETRLPVGYVMAQDRYFKRDDVGIVYQMNVSPGAQRKLVGAMLLRAVFERAAYGCRLFCCWCAQDLEANRFWESLGFIPLAFRTGSVGKGKVRTHIFWQRRIREGDVTTPYWYPCKTDGGALRGDRLVLPIPPGVHWSDPMPVLLPSGTGPVSLADESTTHGARATGKRNSKFDPTKGPVKTAPGQFGPPKKSAPAPVAEPVKRKPARVKTPKPRIDPIHLAKARELRDRYLEQFNSGLVLPQGKYDVCKVIAAAPAPKMLEAA